MGVSLDALVDIPGKTAPTDEVVHGAEGDEGVVAQPGSTENDQDVRRQDQTQKGELGPYKKRVAIHLYLLPAPGFYSARLGKEFLRSFEIACLDEGDEPERSSPVVEGIAIRLVAASRLVSSSGTSILP